MKILNKKHIITGKVLFVQKIIGHCVESRIEFIVQELETKNRKRVVVSYDSKEGYIGDSNYAVVGDVVEVHNLTIAGGLLVDKYDLVELKIVEKTD